MQLRRVSLCAAPASVLLSLCWLTVPPGGATPVTHTVGPLTLEFFNEGDVGYWTGTKDWTAAEIDAVKIMAQTYTDTFLNPEARPVQIDLFWGTLGGGAIGQSLNPIEADGTVAGTYAEWVWRDGENLSQPGPPQQNKYDSALQFNQSFTSPYTWNIGTEAPISTEIDFRSVVVHEFAHTFGFGVSTYQSGTDTWSTGGITNWDSFLRDSAGNAPEVGTTGEPGNFNQVDNPVYFVGGNARAAYGGNDVPIYAPLTFAPGSSLAHLNEAQFASYVMSYSIAPGQYNRTLSSLEWGVFEDIGWILPGVVPEPGTAVVILATSLLALRRRAARQPAP